MAYEAQDFSHLLGMQGFSDTLLNNHFTLYQGYVKNTNTLMEKLKTAEAGTPEYNELSRRFGWEWNGMRLHELYFGNMTKDKKDMGKESSLYKKMVEDFGSGEQCEKNFKATAGLRGIGWVVMYYDKKADRLFNVWIDDHATNHLTGAKPILIMDMWEHAFMIDYGLKKPEYMDAFINSVNWEEADRRFEEAKR
ncbi:MAG TPA: superoxide dismutase [Candidatus Kapabacteria bacterium]|nr:superoxide dismutase [Candidatus Kapabacteria bacterium]